MNRPNWPLIAALTLYLSVLTFAALVVLGEVRL